MADEIPNDKTPPKGETTRRDFLTLTAGAAGAVGVGAAAIPFVNSMNPAADVLALATVDVDIQNLKKGQSKTITWRGKPVFIRHRTENELATVQKTDLKTLKDPETDKERFSQNPDFLVVVGICTHLGCIPSERKNIQAEQSGGWLCACHGSLYDESGRILKGPAPTNLEVPPHDFLNNNTVIRIG